MKLTVALALLPLVSAVPANKPKPKPAPLKYPGLDVLAKRVGLLYFGTAVDNVVLDNSQYVSIARNRSDAEATVIMFSPKMTDPRAQSHFHEGFWPA